MFHFHIPSEIHTTEIHILSLTSPLQNCFKSPHNSINHFDTDFDTHPKYPLTTIYNKLSDNLKNTQKLPKSEKLHKTSTHSPPKHHHHQSQNHLSTKPLNKHPHTTNQLREHLSPPNSLRNNPHKPKNNPIKIRPEFKIPVLNHTSPPLKITTTKGYF